MENKKPKKEIESVINSKLAEQIKARRKNLTQSAARGYHSLYLGYDSTAFLPVGGYKLKELPNNKPMTLLQVKADAKINFVSFVAIRCFNDGSDCLTFFDINENKKTIEPIAGLQMFGYGWGDPRKDGERIAIITNAQMSTYYNNIKKHNTRVKLSHIFNMCDRFAYNNKDRQEWQNKNPYITLWGCSWNPLEEERWDSLSSNYLTFENKNIVHNCKTRKELYNFMFDKNGYFKLSAQVKLKQRAEELRRKKKEEADRIAKDNFIKADKTEILKAISDLIFQYCEAVRSFANFDKLMTPGVGLCIIVLKNNIKELQHIYNNINDYARYTNPGEEIAKEIKKYQDEYKIILTQYHTHNLNWCGVGCYRVEDDKIIARYDWIGKEGTSHAGEVVCHPVNISL